MDDLRFDALPRAQAFDALIAAIGSASPIAAVVAAAVAAGEETWRRAAGSEALARALAELGALAAAPAPFESLAPAGDRSFAALVAGLADRLGALRGAGDWDDADEIATLAVLEGFAAALERVSGSPAGAQGDARALASLATAEGRLRTTRAIFARLGARLVAYVLDRELAQHVGEGRRFRSVAALGAFRLAIEAHVRGVAERGPWGFELAAGDRVRALRAALIAEGGA